MAATKESLIIPLSFKQKEKWLYDELKNNSSPSATIKDILILYFEGKLIYTNSIDKKQNIENNNQIINTSPFNLI